MQNDHFWAFPSISVNLISVPHFVCFQKPFFVHENPPQTERDGVHLTVQQKANLWTGSWAENSPQGGWGRTGGRSGPGSWLLACASQWILSAEAHMQTGPFRCSGKWTWSDLVSLLEEFFSKSMTQDQTKKKIILISFTKRIEFKIKLTLLKRPALC